MTSRFISLSGVERIATKKATDHESTRSISSVSFQKQDFKNFIFVNLQ